MRIGKLPSCHLDVLHIDLELIKLAHALLYVGLELSKCLVDLLEFFLIFLHLGSPALRQRIQRLTNFTYLSLRFLELLEIGRHCLDCFMQPLYVPGVGQHSV